MEIRIEGSDLPGLSCDAGIDRPDGHRSVHVGVQRRNKPRELLDLTPGDAPSATWTLDCTVGQSPAGIDFKGPYIQGPPGGRFIYLSWGDVDQPGRFDMFRRAKLWLTAVLEGVLGQAIDGGVLVGRLGLTDPKGHPLCAAVRPPVIEWSAEGSVA